jgi:hypothetical protein
MSRDENDRWSNYYDLENVTKMTGLRIIEWDDIKPLTTEQKSIGLKARSRPFRQQWSAIAENLTCDIIMGFGRDQGVRGTDRRFSESYFLRLEYQNAPSRGPNSSSSSPEFQSIEQKYNFHLRSTNDTFIVQDIIERYQTVPDRLFVMLSHTFSIKTENMIVWDTIGQYIRFNEKLLDFTHRLVEEHMNPFNVNGRYIAVHYRRDDISLKCNGRISGKERLLDPYACLATLSEFEVAVNEVQIRLGPPRLPVIVTTDSKDPEERLRISRLGWSILSHEEYITDKYLGSFGAPSVDAAVLANAEAFVGTGISTMSRIAGNRQSSWHNHRPIFPSV